MLHLGAGSFAQANSLPVQLTLSVADTTIVKTIYLLCVECGMNFLVYVSVRTPGVHVGRVIWQ